jgi:hypothetical protein
MGDFFQPFHLIIFLIVLTVVFLVCRLLWRLGSKTK